MIYRVLLAAWIGFFGLPVTAATDNLEREALATLLHELDALTPVIEKAASAANPDSRITFHYPWLQRDIDRLKQGIKEHLYAPQTTPRKIPPLKGDYRQ